MKEIIFRGKRADNGEWVEGWLMNEHIIPKEQEFTVECRNPQYFVDTDKLELYEIIPSTIGQYTGLTDKNGLTKIFEGDIVKVENALVRGIFAVEYCGISACFIVSHGERRYFLGGCNSEVIGNIHDNPELLNK